MTTAYLDNCIACAQTLADLGDPAEMAALRSLEKPIDDGRLEIVTSHESWREQERTKEPTIRALLKKARPDVPLVKENDKDLGMLRYDDGLGGYSSYGIRTEYVDAGLYETFKKAGLKDADARHLMYAVHNKCDRFVTTDPHFFDRLPQLSPLCRNTKIVRPSELAAEF
jgi:hypothetical protein